MPGSSRVCAPVAMMQWSKVRVSELPSDFATLSVCASRKVPRPSYSAILFLRIR